MNAGELQSGDALSRTPFPAFADGAAPFVRMFRFSLGGREVFALPVECVAEVMPAPELTRLVGGDAGHAGMFVWRGDVVNAYHLAQVLGLPAAPAAHLMVLSSEGAGQPVAMLFDRVVGVAEYAAAQFHPVPLDCRTNGFLSSVIVDDEDRLISVLDGPSMFHPHLANHASLKGNLS